MIAKNAAAAAFSNAEVTRNVPNSHPSRLNRLLWWKRSKYGNSLGGLLFVCEILW